MYIYTVVVTNNKKEEPFDTKSSYFCKLCMTIDIGIRGRENDLDITPFFSSIYNVIAFCHLFSYPKLEKNYLDCIIFATTIRLYKYINLINIFNEIIYIIKCIVILLFFLDEPGVFIGKIIPSNPSRAFLGYVDQKASEKKIVHDVFRKGDSAFISGINFVYNNYGCVSFVKFIN